MSKKPYFVKGWRYNQDEHHHEVASAEHGEDAKMPKKKKVIGWSRPKIYEQ